MGEIEKCNRVALARRTINRKDPVIEVAPIDFGSQSLRVYRDVLCKRRWEILTALLVVLTTVTIYSFKARPVYEATARLEIEAEAPDVQSVTDLYRNIVPTDERFMKTQVQVLESDNLAWQTIQQLGLATNPRFATHRQSGDGPTLEPRATRDPLMREFRRSLSVELAPNSRIVEASFESTDPELAARVVNTLVADYVEYNFHTKYDATRQASGWMEQQLDELKVKVENSQQALVDYERQHAIVNISDKQNVLEQRLEDLSRDLTSAESERAQKESLYDLVEANEAQVALLVQNELLQKLEEKQADLKAQYVDVLGQYGPNFPRVARLRDQAREIQLLIEGERKRTVARIRNDYLSALGRQKLLATAVAHQKTAVGNLNQLLIQHNLLEREFETNQQLYESLLKRLKDATVSAGLRGTNIHVLDSAEAPAVPVRPNKVLNIAVGAMVGLLLGITLAFVQESLDYSIKSSEDVESLIGVPSLAIIPTASSASTSYAGIRRKDAKVTRNGSVALAVVNEPASGLAEAYRALRTSVLFSSAPRPPQTLLVTSTQSNEGKTCTSLNLALALGQRGGRVLVVESDLRKPGIARALGLHGQNGQGLSGVLTGACGLEDALQEVKIASGLWVLPAGPSPPNPAELLSSASMEKVVEELRQRFDHMVLDSPPLLPVTDATVLSTLVDGVILVVESGVTSRGALVRAYKTIRIAGGRVLGVVLNKVNFRQNGYYYGSYDYRCAYYDADPHSRAPLPEATSGFESPSGPE